MFMVIIRYTKSLEEVDLHRASHLSFIENNIEQGRIMVAGRQVPANGGAFLAKASKRQEIEDMVKQDPYYVHHVAQFEIIEFMAAKTHESCRHLQGQ